MMIKGLLRASLLSLLFALPAHCADKVVKATPLSEQEKFFAKYQPAEEPDYLKMADWNDLMANGRKAYDKHDYVNAERYYRQALQVSVDNRLPVEKVVYAMDSLTLVYLATNAFAKSVPNYKNELALLPRKKGLYDSEFNAISLQLALVLERIGKVEEAQELYKSVIDLDRKQGKDKLTRIAAAHLGFIYYREKDAKRSEPLLRQAFKLCLEQKEIDVLTFRSARALADLLLSRRDFKGAEPFYKVCLSMPRDTKEVTSEEWVAVYAQYAVLLKQTGHVAEATKYWKEKDLYSKTNSPPRPH